MNAKQFKDAFKIANNPNISLLDEDIAHIVGYGLPNFKPVVVTLRQAAFEMRWSSLLFNGKWDGGALNEFRALARKNFIVID